MNWTIKIILKTLMTKISCISWGSYDKCFYGKDFIIIKNLGKDVAVVAGLVELNWSSDPRKGLLSPLGSWILPASAVWTCAWQNNIHVWVGRVKVDSHEIPPCKFSALTPSSGQPNADFSVWNKTTTTPCVDWGNPPYKGGWLKIGYNQERGMNQNTPNSRLALRWFHPL